MGDLLRYLCAPSFPSHLPQSCIIISWCPQHQAPSWSISILLHVQTTFLHPASSSLDVLSTRRPPGTSPSSSMCKPPSSMLHHHLLMSSAPGALPEHLHPPPRASRLHPPRIVSWRPHRRVSSWDISTLLRVPPQMLQLACALLLPQHMHQVASLLCSSPAHPAAGLLPPILAPMGHCSSPPRAPAWLCHPARAWGQSLNPISLLRLCHHLSPQAQTRGNGDAPNPASSFPTLQPTSPATWVPRR